MLLTKLIQSLVTSPNAAADDVLLEALTLGNEPEKLHVLDALMQRQTIRGLKGVVARLPILPASCRQVICQRIPLFRQPIRLCARDNDPAVRNAAIHLIVYGNATDLAYLLCEHLRDSDEQVADSAATALRYLVLRHRRRLADLARRAKAIESADAPLLVAELTDEHHRGQELAAALLRAAMNNRGAHSGAVSRAVLLLARSPATPVLPLLQTERHSLAGQITRHLQHPDSPHTIPAMLLAVMCGPLRSRFPLILAHTHSPRTLTALLQHTYQLKDRTLHLCLHNSSRGTWFEPGTLSADLMQRSPLASADIAAWVAASALSPEIQSQLFLLVYMQAQGDHDARARLLHHVLQAPAEARLPILQQLASDPDDGIAAAAARALVRCATQDMTSVLLPLLKRSQPALRSFISRVLSERSFEQFWLRYEHMPRIMRLQAGKAMLKLVTDAPRRLTYKLLGGPQRQRLKAMDIITDLDLVSSMWPTIARLQDDADPRIRSHAVLLARRHHGSEVDVMLTRALLDSDDRVRANAIDVLDALGANRYETLLQQRATSRANRERANAIRTLYRIDPLSSIRYLETMLADRRPEHRISALWAIGQIRQWQLLQQVIVCSHRDPDPNVRRYAATMLRLLKEQAREHNSIQTA